MREIQDVRMDIPGTNSPLLRDVLLRLLVLGLLTAPLWVTVVDIDEPRYTYDRTEVVVNDTRIEYADRGIPQSNEPLSDDIKCTAVDPRTCALERRLADGGSAPSRIYIGSTGARPPLEADYRYVQVEGAVYRAAAEVNTSAQRVNGLYRVDATLEPADADLVLSEVSIEPDYVPSVVAKTARGGPTTSKNEVDIPETPIELDDGTYYRVYLQPGLNEPPAVEKRLSDLLTPFLTFVAPFVGMYILIRLPRQFEISYVGDRNRD